MLLWLGLRIFVTEQMKKGESRISSWTKILSPVTLSTSDVDGILRRTNQQRALQNSSRGNNKNNCLVDHELIWFLFFPRASTSCAWGWFCFGFFLLLKTRDQIKSGFVIITLECYLFFLLLLFLVTFFFFFLLLLLFFLFFWLSLELALGCRLFGLYIVRWNSISLLGIFLSFLLRKENCDIVQNNNKIVAKLMHKIAILLHI